MRHASAYAHPDFAHFPSAEWAPRRFWVASTPIESVIVNGMAPKLNAVEVYANHGRWIAECPDCRGAQLASTDDHRFMCNNCANAGVGGLWRPLLWPTGADKIAEALEARPLEHTRNWMPGETLKHLMAENAGHGVG